jgi:lantibiotic leader peptide-processing serine protease
VIEMKGGESSDFAAAVAARGGKIERRLRQLNMVVVQGLSAAGAAELAARSDVAEVTQDVRVRWIPSSAGLRKTDPAPSTTKRDPRPAPVDQSGAFFFPFQWNIRVTKANAAWLTTPEGSGATVYLLDSGIDPTHPDLAGRVDVGKSVSFSEIEPEDILDRESHGTFVAGLVSSNGIGVASVAPLATLVAVKVIDKTGSGSFADVISGLIYAADQGADVINVSLGTYVDMTIPAHRKLVAHLQAAIGYARAKGSLVIAAAGNEGLDLLRLPPQILSVPAELAGVVSVGATAPINQQSFDLLASYSNFGWNSLLFGGGVQLFAPGGDFVQGGLIIDLLFSVCSQFQETLPFKCGPEDYVIGAGTSFASPMVAGEAAVLRSILGGSRSASFINTSCLLQGTDVIGGSAIFGRGRMNVVKAAGCATREGRSRRSFAN